MVEAILSIKCPQQIRNGNFLSKLDQIDLATVLTLETTPKDSAKPERVGRAISGFTDLHRYVDQQGLLETRKTKVKSEGELFIYGQCPTTVGHWRGPVNFSVPSEDSKQTPLPCPVTQTSRTVSCRSFSKGQRRNSEGSSCVGMRFGVRKRRCGSR